MRWNDVRWEVCVAVLFALSAGCGSSGAAAGNTSLGSSGNAGMSGMSGMSGVGSSAGGSNGMSAMPIVPLGQAVWQGMRIQARATAPATFVVVTGTSERTIHPAAKASMHLMVMLTDARTGMPIPYATVWATIRQDDRIVYDARQWPMLSRSMGVHYGNNVALPGAGRYVLDLLIGPPESARHLEYAHVWLHPHRVRLTFHWKPGM